MMNTIMKNILFAALMLVHAFIAVSCSKYDNPDEGTYYVHDGDFLSYDSAVVDYDGNVYRTVWLGEQCWMAENLRTTHYADGTEIPLGDSASYTKAYRYFPSNNEMYISDYGYLYNWAAVMKGNTSSNIIPSGVQGICPTGWHVPSNAEWGQLIDYVSSQSEYVCSGNGDNIAKALAADHGWLIFNGNECTVGNDPGGNNATGFSALPAGFYHGSYGKFGYNAYFWSATEYDDYGAYFRYLTYNYASVRRYDDGKNYGFSVRCVRD